MQMYAGCLPVRNLKKEGASKLCFKNDVRQWIAEDPSAYHTTLIDFYGLSTDFPGVVESKGMPGNARAELLEQNISNGIDHYKFIPYIQLHEYEALLFSAPDVMYEYLNLYENNLPAQCFQSIRGAVDNPEAINDGPETAPSKRFLKLCPSYDKVGDGILMLEDIGLERIRQECPRFNEWLTKLEALPKISANPSI